MMAVVVVTGSGGIGLACARRLGAGHPLVLAEADGDRLNSAVTTLRDEGFSARGYEMDVSDGSSVSGLADFAAEQGPLGTLVHTAGLSPTMASGKRILEVNLRGTAHLVAAFESLAEPGSVGVFVASMAGHLWPIDDGFDRAVAAARPNDIIGATGLADDVDSSTAYAVSKRGVIVRIVAAAPAWGARGARIVSVSPGMIATPMGHQEYGATPLMEEMKEGSPIPRLGTPTDIAEAVAWLAGSDAGFVTGTDLLVDGGVVASLRGWSSPT
jgi:NAD(P)-dependent dehydrogenase (short-subunit alcohol dehydrogenase family)